MKAGESAACAGQSAEGRQELMRVRLMLPFRLGSVNCYLIGGDTGCILVDTGGHNARAALEMQLASAGCRPGDIRLIVLTHGDFDHTGNAGYLRARFGGRIAMHRGDSGMAEQGDMFWNRRSGNALLRAIVPVFSGFGRAERFTPDLYVEDGHDLSGFGLAARIVHIPGHSSGSIGVLTASGQLFCGDLLTNAGRPVLNQIMDDPAAGRASIEKLRTLHVDTVYPGHGEPFSLGRLAREAVG